MAQLPFTAYANIYTHPSGTRHQAIAGIVPYKSGLTPLFFPTNATTQQVREIRKLEDYQIGRFEGFTADHLRILKTLAIEDQTPEPQCITLFTPIHPALDKPRWVIPLPKHLAQYPLGRGRPGYWHVGNDEVWNALQPPLRLVSQVLANIHTWPWFDALLNTSSYEQIPMHDLPDSDKPGYFERFKLRPPVIADPDRENVRQKLLMLSQRIQFNLASGWEETGPNLSYCSGITHPATGWQGTTCNISFQLLEPLISPIGPYLTPAERAICQFQVAVTILHEFTHALYIQMNNEHPNVPQGTEPYFHNEPFGELGYSMEAAVFGGTNTRFNRAFGSEPRGLPPGGIFRSDVPNVYLFQKRTVDQPILLPKPPLWLETIEFPIPCSYFMFLQNELFWNLHVKRKGSSSTHMGPRIFGSRFEWDQGRTDNLVSFPDGLDYEVPLSDSMTPQERWAAQFENNRRGQALTVAQALVNTNAAQIHLVNKILGADQHGAIVDYGSQNPANGFGGPHTFQYPRFDPGCPRFEEIQLQLASDIGRRALALDSLYFEIPEHVLLDYFIRSGMQIDATELRGFLLVCESRVRLFSVREWGSPPTPTVLMVRRIDEGWPTERLPPRNIYSQLPANYMKGPLLIIEAFDAATADAMATNKNMFETPDFDKDIFGQLANIALAKMGSEYGQFTISELDACIDYYERLDQKWFFGPVDIIRKSQYGWGSSQSGSSPASSDATAGSSAGSVPS